METDPTKADPGDTDTADTDPAARPGSDVEALARLAAELTAAEPGGRLDLAALGRARELEAWAARIASDPGLSALPAARDVVAFDCARRFYLAGEDAPVLPAGVLKAPRDGGWREELLLRATLLADGSAYPGPSDARFLYHTRDDSGAESWRWEVVRREATPPAGAASWLVEQRFFDAAGRSVSTRALRVVRAERSFVEQVLDPRGGTLAESRLFDLARPDPQTSVRTFEIDDVPRPPAELGLGASRWVAFRAALARSERRALVVEGATATLWLSPEFGLVRAEHGGRTTHELVFAELPR
jgi:hypothetical protein